MATTGLLETLIALCGDDNVIVVRRPLVQFTGSLEAGMMLSQLLYWTGRATLEGGWIAKSDASFSEELCLTPYATRKARSILETAGYLETKLARFGGAPRTHYRLRKESLTEAWTLWIRKVDFAKTDNGLCESEQSCTETTTETTTEKRDSGGKPPSPPPPPKRKATISKPRHPAVDVFREAAHCFPPKSWWEKVAEAVGSAEKGLTYWREVVEAWVGRGYNPKNIAGMLDWFGQGRIPERGGNGRQQTGERGGKDGGKRERPPLADSLGEWGPGEVRDLLGPGMAEELGL